MSEPLKTVRRGRVLEVMLDRPKANAIDAATSIRMGEIFCDFRDDESLWVAILTGAGDRIFSAGWDLKAATEGEAVRSAWSEQAAMSEALIVGIEPTATPGRVHRCRTSPRRATRFRRRLARVQSGRQGGPVQIVTQDTIPDPDGTHVLRADIDAISRSLGNSSL